MGPALGVVPALQCVFQNGEDATEPSNRGIIQYYLLASDVFRFARLRWVMETSLLKTLAGKHRSTVTAMARKFKAKVDTPAGPRTCLQVITERPGRKSLVARFGGIPLRRNRHALVIDKVTTKPATQRKEPVSRLLAGRCELCGGIDGIVVHHARSLAALTDRRQPHPDWVTVMLKKRSLRRWPTGAPMTAFVDHGTPAGPARPPP